MLEDEDELQENKSKKPYTVAMFDVGHRDGGCSIVLATSHDQNYPPENMIDGQEETFWTSTGLYPQEFVVAFGHTMDVQRITLSSYNIREIQIEKCSSPDGLEFEPIDGPRTLNQTDGQLQVEDFGKKFQATHLRFKVFSALNQTDGQLQVEDFGKKFQATHLRFKVFSGYDHFFSVHKLNINGNAVHG